MRSLKLTSLVCAAIMAAASNAKAAPDDHEMPVGKPVRFIVPYAAGGGLDFMCRVIAEQLSTQIKAPVVVENRAGGSGSIGVTTAARSAPDGQTLLCANTSEITLTQFIIDNPEFRPERDLKAVTMAVRQTVALVANPATPVMNARDLVELARKENIAYGHSGIGSGMHLVMEMFSKNAGIKMTGVPYSGGIPLVPVLSGEVQFTALNLAPLMPHIRTGKLRPLVVFRPDRSPVLPDVPTAKEVLGQEVVVPSWFGFFVPSATPDRVRYKLDEELRKALAVTSVREKLTKSEMEVVGMPSDQFQAFVTKERDANAAQLRELRIKLN